MPPANHYVLVPTKPMSKTKEGNALKDLGLQASPANVWGNASGRAYDASGNPITLPQLGSSMSAVQHGGFGGVPGAVARAIGTAAIATAAVVGAILTFFGFGSSRNGYAPV